MGASAATLAVRHVLVSWRATDPEAEFTPRNVQTAEERSRLVYRVKVSADNTSGVLKEGMPVEAELRLQ